MAQADAPLVIAPDRAWQDRERLFRVFHHYGLNYYSMTFGVAVFMVENGSVRNPMGHDNMMANLEAYACPAVPKDDRRIAAATLAMNKALASFVLSDVHRRREFFKYWSSYYHAGGPARDPAGQQENNAAYALMTREVYEKRAVPWMKSHGLDKMRTADMYLFKPQGDWSGTVWVP